MSGKALALDKGSMAIITNTFEYDGVWYPPFVRPHILDRIRSFEVREDDLILSTFSKCGESLSSKGKEKYHESSFYHTKMSSQVAHS